MAETAEIGRDWSGRADLNAANCNNSQKSGDTTADPRDISGIRHGLSFSRKTGEHKKGGRHEEDLEPVPLFMTVIFPVPVARLLLLCLDSCCAGNRRILFEKHFFKYFDDLSSVVFDSKSGRDLPAGVSHGISFGRGQ